MAKKKVTETVAPTEGASLAKGKEDYKYDEYAVRNAVDKLLEAECIKGDPKLMKLVSAELGKKQKAIASLTELRQAKKDVQEADVKAAYGEDEAEEA
jgi:hypothetical protein